MPAEVQAEEEECFLNEQRRRGLITAADEEEGRKWATQKLEEAQRLSSNAQDTDNASDTVTLPSSIKIHPASASTNTDLALQANKDES